jgi:tRNA(fMet)-specific endonuclease VapC
VTEQIARHYGRLFAAFRKAGTPIPTNDIWIGACALDAGAHVISYDRDFGRMTGLDCTILLPPSRQE